MPGAPGRPCSWAPPQPQQDVSPVNERQFVAPLEVALERDARIPGGVLDVVEIGEVDPGDSVRFGFGFSFSIDFYVRKRHPRSGGSRPC